MGRSLSKLSVKEVKSIKRVGRHSDGGGLYLQVRKTGSKYWLFKYKKKNKVTELGIGSVNYITLLEARKKAAYFRERVRKNLPLVEIEEVVARDRTFFECLEAYLETKEVVWTNEKHKTQWHMTLKVYAKPLHKLSVQDIKTPHILKILKPMWLTKNETASRLRARIEAVIDYAKAMGWKSGENPAVLKGNLGLLLPEYSRTKNIQHHAALEVNKMPDFMRDLRGREAIVARLLEFIILTASRSGEARHATWSEINFEERIWRLSSERMKMKKAHTVPLCSSVLSLLKELQDIFPHEPDDLIFRNPVNMKPYSYNATRALLQRMRNERLTTHGFRSTFRDWAGDNTDHQRETIEAALAHSLKNKAEAAYRRSTALEKRRVLMQDWDNYCSNKVTLKANKTDKTVVLEMKIQQLENKIKELESA